jgi:IclR family acetate operon transcriptional repressor
LLATLVERRYVVRSAATGRYLLGHKLNELSGAVTKRTERLQFVARPHLESIQKVTGESANLSVLEPPNIVYVDQVEGTRSVRMFARLGAAVPAHATAAGKVMLAYMRWAAAADIWGSASLPQLTPRTITSLDVLEKELGRVRRRGYAIDNEEQEPGVGCVAAPIFDHDGAATAALSVSAPTPRIYASDPAELGELLMTRTKAISDELGFVGNTVTAR